MLVGLEGSVALGGVFHQQLGNQVLGLVAAFMEGLSIQCIDALLDAHEDGSHIFSIERRAAAKQNVEDDPTGPIIDLLAILSIDDLRSKIHGGAFWLVLKLFLLEDLGNTEVDQLDALDIVFFLQQDVFGLEVAVADVVVMQVSNGREDLPHYDGCLRLCDELLLHNQVEQLPSLAHLSHQVDGLLCLVNLVELDDIWVV